MNKKILVGIGLTFIFLFLVFRNIDFDVFLKTFSRIRLEYVLIASVIMIFELFLRALRWRYLLYPQKKTGITNLFSATAISYMANNILPLRIGEVVRAYVIKKSENVSGSGALATIVVERVIDVVSILVLMAIVVFFQPIPQVVKTTGYFILAFSVVFFTGAFFIRRNSVAAISFLKKVFFFLPEKLSDKIFGFLESFIQGLSGLKSASHYIIVFLMSVILWLFYGVMTYLMFIAFGYVEQYNITFIAAITINVFLAIGVSVPSGPAFIGPYHYACQQGMILYSISNDEAVAFAVVLHAVTFLPITFVGLYFFWKEQLKFSEIRMKDEKDIINNADTGQN